MLRTPIRRRSLWSEFLFKFDTIGGPGMSRWIRLHRDNPRIVLPLLRLLELREASLQTPAPDPAVTEGAFMRLLDDV